MSDPPFKLNFELEEFKALRSEIDFYIAEVRLQERNAVIAVGIIWGWLIANHKIHPLLWAAPVFLVLAIVVRSVYISKHIQKISNRIQAIEKSFGVEGWEHTREKQRNRASYLASLGFMENLLNWLLLVLTILGWIFRLRLTTPSMMKRLLILTTLLPILATSQDVHVHVLPGSPSAAPGNEDLTLFPTIQNALDHHPLPGPGGRVFIEIAPGTYRERIIITQNHHNVTMLGLGAHPEDTVITNSLNAKTAGGTFFTETAEINGDGFQAANLTFENSAGNTGQAVAAAVRADRAVFRHVRFLGHQDTLFADFGRQYYLDCFITGGVDFIFGNAAAVFDRSELQANGPGFLTAQSRTAPTQPTGYVILNSRVTSSIDHTAAAMDPTAPGAKSAASAKKMIGLGRPWRPYSRVVFLNTSLPADLDPLGWNNWGKPANERTAWFAEYGSTGPGASPETRVLWTHPLKPADTKQFLPATFLRGTDNWNPEAAAAALP